MRCLRAILFALLFCSLVSGCRPHIVRVPITPEDVMRANAASGDGDIAFARRDYYAALIKFLEAGRLNPNSEHIYNKIGITYSRLKFYPLAIEAFNRSIGLNPKYSFSYNNLGSVYFADNNKKQAERCFRKAISLKDDEAPYYVNLGTLLFEKNQFDKGLQLLRKALALDPDIFKKAGDSSLVAAIAQKDSGEKNYFMARFYASTGDVDRALENLQQSLMKGYTNLEGLQTEKDFDPIRQDEKFIAFMKYAMQIIK
jgi:tetratricopeptide (TPR) repeat protein